MPTVGEKNALAKVKRRRAEGKCRGCEERATRGVFCDKHSDMRDGYRQKHRKTSCASRRRIPLKEPSCGEVELAYLAGIVDGEGCIYFARSKKGQASISLGVKVSMTTFLIINMLHDRLGGSVVNKSDCKEATLPQKAWSATGEQAYLVLKAIGPYLVGKKEQCQLGIEYFERVRNAPRTGYRMIQHTPETVAYQETVYLKMKELKKFGGR